MDFPKLTLFSEISEYSSFFDDDALMDSELENR